MTRRLFRVLALAAALAWCWASAPAAALNPNHNCDYCHKLHGSGGQQLLTDPVIENVCQACHDPLVGTAPRKAAVHTNKAGSTKAAFRMSCTVCHETHDSLDNPLTGTPNLMMIGTQQDGTNDATISTPNSGVQVVAFLSRGTDAGGASLYSFADDDEDLDTVYSGACEVCHTDTDNHQNNPAGNHGHNTGLNCTLCHPHVESFWGSGGACSDCHNTPQDNSDGLPAWQAGRREILSEFSRTSHHLVGPLDVADCETCHLQDQHQQGIVRLRDPDNPASGTPLVVLNGGDPLTDPVEAATLTAFCLACHDADGYDGANPTLPFTDAEVPRDVATTWASASHNTVGALSCFGEGTTGCHGSGHGSEKRKLLALADVAPTPPANVEEEEGFCFACHQSGGISSVDVQSGFATAILTADDTTQYGLTLNDRHDVQYTAQTQSGAKIECTDCHDPHEANSLQPWKSDPDPSDGRVPGTNWFEGLAGAGLGVDAYTEFCLDCHDGSFPAGVTDHAAGPLVDILNASWLTNSHGAGASAASLKTGYAGGVWALDDVLPCWACHQAHPDDTPQPVTATVYNNLFQMKQTITAADGATPIDADDGQLQFYEISTLLSKKQTPNQDNVNSYYLCNTCHVSSMGSGKPNCSNCHTHSDGRF